MSERLISFPRPTQEVAMIGNNALKLDQQPQFRFRLVADVVDFDAFKERKKEAQGSALVYDPEFDRRDYRKYYRLAPSYKEELVSYTKRQLETYIGERLSAVESKTRWNIVDGEIVPEGLSYRLEEIIQNGIEWRREHGNPIDFEREEAELAGFRKTQAILTSPDAPLGTIVLSISAPGKEGSDYKRKFFDVFILKEEDGRRYIEAVRYLSDSEIKDYVKKLSSFKTFEKEPTDADLLANPLDLTGIFETPQEVQVYLSGGVKALEANVIRQILDISTPTAMSYINSLIRDPYNIYDHNLRLNAYLNENDDLYDIFTTKDFTVIQYETRRRFNFSDIQRETKILIDGRRKVKERPVPCPGKSGGFDTSSDLAKSIDPFSVSEYGSSSDKKQEWFNCPKCHYKADGPVGNTCPGCGLTKEKYAQDGGETCD